MGECERKGSGLGRTWWSRGARRRHTFGSVWDSRTVWLGSNGASMYCHVLYDRLVLPSNVAFFLYISFQYCTTTKQSNSNSMIDYEGFLRGPPALILKKSMVMVEVIHRATFEWIGCMWSFTPTKRCHWPMTIAFDVDSQVVFVDLIDLVLVPPTAPPLIWPFSLTMQLTWFGSAGYFFLFFF